MVVVEQALDLLDFGAADTGLGVGQGFEPALRNWVGAFDAERGIGLV